VSIEQILILVIVVAVVSVLAALNIYHARKLGFFRWLKERKRTIAIVLTWSLFIAVLVSRQFWLAYVNNPILFSMPGNVWVEDPSWIGRLNVWDFILIFVSSVVVGALIIDIEAILFGTITNVILSFIFSMIYVSYFVWYVLGYGESFNLVGGFLVWGQFVLWDALRLVFRMTFPLVQLMALLGVFLGAFLRVYIQPSAE